MRELAPCTCMSSTVVVRGTIYRCNATTVHTHAWKFDSINLTKCNIYTLFLFHLMVSSFIIIVTHLWGQCIIDWWVSTCMRHVVLKNFPRVFMPLVSTLPSALSTAVFRPPCASKRRDLPPGSSISSFTPHCWTARGNSHLLACAGGALHGSTADGVVLQWL